MKSAIVRALTIGLSLALLAALVIVGITDGLLPTIEGQRSLRPDTDAEGVLALSALVSVLYASALAFLFARPRRSSTGGAR